MCFLGVDGTHYNPALRVSYDSNKLRGQEPRDRTGISVSTCCELGLLGEQDEEQEGFGVSS